MTREHKKLGEILVELAHLRNEDLQEALKDQENINKRLGDILIDRELISDEQLYHALAIQFGIPWHEKVILMSSAQELQEIISEDTARTYKVAPVCIEQRTLTIAMYDPIGICSLDSLRFVVNCQVEPIMASKSEVLAAIDKVYGNQTQSTPRINNNIIPDMFRVFIENAIKNEGRKVCFGLTSVYDERETLNVSVFSKHEMWSSKAEIVEKGAFSYCVSVLMRNLGIEKVTDVVVISVEESVGVFEGASVSTIILTPGRLAPRIDVYLSYDEKQVRIKSVMKRVVKKLNLLIDSEKWNSFCHQKLEQKELLEVLSFWEESLDNWLEVSGEEDDSQD